MPNILTEYAPSAAMTITLAGLASSASMLGGQESTAIDNTANKYLDFLIAGRIMTGTGPAAGTIEVHVIGILEDATWPDVFDGANSAETITSANIKNSICRPVASVSTDATANLSYPFGPVSVASLFGGSLPKRFVAFATHSTGVNLNATAANHAIWITPVYMTSI